MKKENVKDRIILAASKLFYFDGYNQTGINKIIEKAEVSKDSMYRHFRSKEAIAVVYLEQRHKAWITDMTNYLSVRPEGQERVIAIFDYLNHWLSQVDYRGCGFQNIITDIPKNQNSIKEVVRKCKDDMHRFTLDELNKASSESMDTREISNEIMVLIEGAIMLSQIQKANWPLIAAKKACERLLK